MSLPYDDDGRAGREAPDRHAAIWSTRSKAAIVVVLIVYLFCVGHRPIIYIPGSTEDDSLFVRLGLELASRRWLGAYDQMTLVKGVGFPIFLALNYCVGLPVNMALCGLYGASCLYVASTVRVAVRSEPFALAAFVLLVFLPPLASDETARLNREFFCTGMTLCVVAASINLMVAPCWPRSRWWAAPLAGVLIGWFWITREESVWLLPTLALILVTGLRASRRRRPMLFRAALAVCVALAVLGSIGLTNRLVYGRFTLVEMTSVPFSSALVALEKAAYSDWTAYIPVPRAARAKIYAQSPAFARLKPFLDPVGSRSIWTGSGCDQLPTSCEEIAGGWFLWAVRDAAAHAGLMPDAKTAAEYFAEVEAETTHACETGRLTCARWLAPLVPPFTFEQLRKLPRQIREVAQVAMLWPDPVPGAPPIGTFSGLELQTTELTAVPEHQPGRIVVVRGHGTWDASPLPVSSNGSMQVIDRDVVAEDPAATGETRRPVAFTLTLSCLYQPCVLALGSDPATAVDTPLASLGRMSWPVAGHGALTFDTIDVSPLTIRSRAGQDFNQILPQIHRLYRALMLIGAGCFVLNLGRAGLTRAWTTPFLLALALGSGVAARSFIVALVDATSFPAIGNGYMAPCLPLGLMTALLSILVTWRWFMPLVFRSRRRTPDARWGSARSSYG